MNALQVRDITVTRGAGPVIREVGFTLEPGRITALVGPNGAGKTSLLEAISGVLPAARGSVHIGDVEVTKHSRVARAKLGLAHIEQGRAVFPGLTVLENLKLTARTWPRVDEVLALFPELDKRRNSPTALLSGGEQQMVVLARAFAARPKFLLIDEMSLGLAPVVFTRLLPMVTRFASEGAAILLVEQFTHLALGVSQDAIVVSSGRVTYQGTAEALLAAPNTLHSAYLGE
ncbi:ABC transporter ATP-binding protein [Actinokineospora globicatena]|uniref:ABC transporter ATP-binding protein n=1 Tax=Actinokineospora globicatena TaxID=103729 RepID=A0A9W6QJP0_9PSEU|nr:ATP-binding cassette domain-containing protein [Actinokineospora globicatena]MCP2302804.1 amino acid/amide ABC transporter ATP-binding protein 2, HAAT family (TC 3.A.1.4.-) [Actinokineospora globicatena]GLW78814.1 ABC transporter ATP-binding protein [Actinokineospora globicatena]GLW84519.1 ABC transporter ATP-binding protein [Actinokineospora globicatena]GLW91286.1 ABC transporter ATP-binding protein [Actinokineospora globicatena]